MKIKNVLRTIRNLLTRKFYKNPNVLSDLDTINYLLKNKCSISRFGDGELSIIEGTSIGFQKANEELKNKMIEVSKANDKNFLVCIPDIFSPKTFNKNNLVDSDFIWWKKEKFRREFLWKKYFNKTDVLGDAFISRFYLRKNDKSKVEGYVKKLKQLWDKRDIIFVEGENSRLGYRNDLFDNANSTKRILCPASNAFDNYENILNSIKNNVQKHDLIILALGPTATVMAYDLYKIGFQAYDLGHIDVEYEWFKMKALKKEPILSKHVNECNSLGETKKEDLDKEYLDQIVDKLY